MNRIIKKALALGKKKKLISPGVSITETDVCGIWDEDAVVVYRLTLPSRNS